MHVPFSHSIISVNCDRLEHFPPDFRCALPQSLTGFVPCPLISNINPSVPIPFKESARRDTLTNCFYDALRNLQFFVLASAHIQWLVVLDEGAKATISNVMIRATTSSAQYIVSLNTLFDESSIRGSKRVIRLIGLTLRWRRRRRINRRLIASSSSTIFVGDRDVFRSRIRTFYLRHHRLNIFGCDESFERRRGVANVFIKRQRS
mmetsp:Transcript_20643/g.30343  ORF Transcript_20643/g.30343 Transcript_20643/m.30343 type:complete len:205 (+) Transcript_20643:1746-2360(+)